MSTVEKKVLGDYELLESLGQGGMGEVYRARQRGLDRDVAVKVLIASASLAPEMLRRFARESRIQRELSHPNVVKVLDGGNDGGVQYLVLELIHGVTLRQYIDRSAPLPLDFVLPAARHLADALSYLHSEGIAHRDLKPNNVLVANSGEIKLADFGLSKAMGQTELTREGDLAGTLHYLAPEVVDGNCSGVAADVYMLGVVIYEMVTGRLPYDASALRDWIEAIRHSPPIPASSRVASLPAGVDELIGELLLKDPARRPTAKVVGQQLEAFCTAQQVGSRTLALRADTLLMDLRRGRSPPRITRPSPSRRPSVLVPRLETTAVPAPPAGKPNRGWLVLLLAGAVAALGRMAVRETSRPHRTEEGRVFVYPQPPNPVVVEADGDQLYAVFKSSRSVRLEAVLNGTTRLTERSKVGGASHRFPVTMESIWGHFRLEMIDPDGGERIAPYEADGLEHDLHDLTESAVRLRKDWLLSKSETKLGEHPQGNHILGPGAREKVEKLVKSCKDRYAPLLMLAPRVLDSPGISLEAKYRVYDALSSLRIVDRLAQCLGVGGRLNAENSLGNVFGCGQAFRAAFGPEPIHAGNHVPDRFVALLLEDDQKTEETASGTQMGTDMAEVLTNNTQSLLTKTMVQANFPLSISSTTGSRTAVAVLIRYANYSDIYWLQLERWRFMLLADNSVPSDEQVLMTGADPHLLRSPVSVTLTRDCLLDDDAARCPTLHQFKVLYVNSRSPSGPRNVSSP